MLSPAELVRAVLIPLLLAAGIGGVGRWRGWNWPMPLAAGMGFIAGHALLHVPKLPPGDGTDWLFWLAFPVTLLGVLHAVVPTRWGWLAGTAAGVVTMVVLRPLVPNGITAGAMLGMSIGMAVAGAGLAAVAQRAEERIGPAAVIAGWCIAVGGAGVVVFASNNRTLGIYGLAAAAPLFGLAASMVNSYPARGPARSVAVVAAPLLAGLLVGGHYYVDPGVTWTNFGVLLVAPALLLAGAFVPTKRRWVRGVVAIAAIGSAVAAVAIPTALGAKRAAEADPYAEYGSTG